MPRFREMRPALLPISSAAPETSLEVVPFRNSYRDNLREEEPLLSARIILESGIVFSRSFEKIVSMEHVHCRRKTRPSRGPGNC